MSDDAPTPSPTLVRLAGGLWLLATASGIAAYVTSRNAILFFPVIIRDIDHFLLLTYPWLAAVWTLQGRYTEIRLISGYTFVLSLGYALDGIRMLRFGQAFGFFQPAAALYIVVALQLFAGSVLAFLGRQSYYAWQLRQNPEDDLLAYAAGRRGRRRT